MAALSMVLALSRHARLGYSLSGQLGARIGSRQGALLEVPESLSTEVN